MSDVELVHEVAGRAVEYIQQWCSSELHPEADLCTAQVLIAAGCGPARVPSCELTLRCAWRPSLLERAFSLLGPGELHALHVPDLGPFSRPSASRQLSLQRLYSLRGGGWSDPGRLIQQHAATLTELDCSLNLSFKSNDFGNRALSRCTRLEILTCADRYAPTAWLGLSQLHTLRGVDLTQVTVASIAALAVCGSGQFPREFRHA
jgi:hypothetical protein